MSSDLSLDFQNIFWGETVENTLYLQKEIMIFLKKNLTVFTGYLYFGMDSETPLGSDSKYQLFLFKGFFVSNLGEAL